MELRQLRYFIKVAETLSFSEAARTLNVSQSTLSQQIKQLENELNTVLLERTSHNVSLTECGAQLLPLARRTTAAADQCINRVQDLAELQAGELAIGVTYSFSPILTETLLAFRKAYPKVKLKIYYKPMAELMAMLSSRQVDFVLAFRPCTAVEGVESHMIFQNYLAAIVSIHHPLANRSSISLQELSRYDLALPTTGLQARAALDKATTGYPPMNVKIELNEVNILLKILRQTSLVSVLAEATTHNAEGVKAIRLDFPENEMSGCVHTLKGEYRKHSMLEFVRLLSESIAVRERQTAWL